MPHPWRAMRRWPVDAKVVIGGLVVLLFVVAAIRSPKETATSTAPATTTTSRPRSTEPNPTPSTPPPTTSDATTAPPTTTRPTTTTTEAPAGQAGQVDRLVVASPDPNLPPYRRAYFMDDWDYDSSTGCNIRERVLIAESQVPVTYSSTSRCHPEAGRWRSAYDGLVTTDPDDLQIDHMIPLAVAWRSGAASWSEDQRHRFANDLTDPNTLVAVSASSNESKSDRTPDEWLPPDRSAWCSYAQRWVEVKARWHLTVTPAEKATLVQILSGC